MDIATLQKWMMEEIYPQSKEYCSRFILPTVADLHEMCRGRNAEIWEYAMKHVFSAKTVSKVKGNLKLKHALSKQPSNETVQERSALIDQLLKARAKKKHLEKTISEMQSKITTAESRISDSKTRIMQLRHKIALLKMYHFMVEEKIAKYEQMDIKLKKRITEFQSNANCRKMSLPLPRGKNFSTVSSPGLETSISNLLDEVTEIIQKKCKYVDDKYSPLDRTTMHVAKKGMWQEMNNILQEHSLMQVVNCLTSLGQEAAMNIKKQCDDANLIKDARNFKLKQNSDKDIVDPSSKSFHSISDFLESTRVLHIEKFLDTENNKNTVAKHNMEIASLKKAIHSMLNEQSNEKKENLESIMPLLELEATVAGKQRAVKSLKKELVNVELNIANLNHVKMDLLSKYKKIENFQSIVECKQDLLCYFLKYNLDTAGKTTAEQEQVNRFVKDTLFKNKMHTEEKIHCLLHFVEKEAALFKSLPLSQLLSTSLESSQHVPVQSLSIYMPHGNFNLVEKQAFYSLMGTLNFLPFEGPEYLLQKAILMKTALKMNKACEATKNNLLCHMKKKREEKSSSICITDVTSQMKKQNRNELTTLLPHVKDMSVACEKGLAMCQHLEETLLDWKEQPAQLLVPEYAVEGKTLQQWLHLWSTTAMELTNMRHITE